MGSSFRVVGWQAISRNLPTCLGKKARKPSENLGLASRGFYSLPRRRGAAPARLGMATNKIRADINFIDPHPRAKTRARTCARYPSQVENGAHIRYPRIPACPRAHPSTRKLKEQSKLRKPKN